MDVDTTIAVSAVGVGGSSVTYQVITEVLTVANLSISLAVGVGGLILLYCRIRTYMKKSK